MPADLVVGSNIRAVRLRKGMSQVVLAEHIGVTFQQVQKYENGQNRVSAGRLTQIAAALDVSVIGLFLGVTDAWSGNRMPAPITDKQALRAAAALSGIADSKMRSALLALIDRVSEMDWNFKRDLFDS